MAKTEPTAAASPAKKSGKLGMITGFIVFGLMSPYIMPTVVLFVVGMMPTLVALITDQDRQRSTALSIGFLNFAGVVPFMLDLFIKGQSWPNLTHILSDSTTWLVMLGTAAIGQLIIVTIPPVLTSLTTIRLESRLKLLQQNLDRLKTTWGPDVGTTTSLDKLAQRE